MGNALRSILTRLVAYVAIAIATGRRIDYGLQGNIGASPWPVLDNELLAKPLREPLRN